VRQLRPTGGIVDGDQQTALGSTRVLPLGVRLAVIIALGAVGWAMILGPLYLLW